MNLLRNCIITLISGWLELNRTYVPIPWAYDAMKHMYDGKDIKCGMMVGVDYLNQCPDNDKTNNFAVFPVIVSINNATGESKLKL